MQRLRPLHRFGISAFALVMTLAIGACGGASPLPSNPVGSSPSGRISANQVGFSPGGPLIWESDADLGRDLDSAASTGAKWIRLDVNWTGIQPGGPTDWHWTYADRAVTAIQRRGMQVLMTLDYTPTWARKPSCASSMFCPPASPQAYAAFAGAAAGRYGARGVHSYEIWNEPNWAPWWIGAPDAPAYVALLKAAYPAIHVADPLAMVITGGLAPHGDLDATPNDPISPVNYLKAMYAAGALGFFDAMGMHPYPPLPDPPLSGRPSWNALLQTGILHDTMVNNGDVVKPIWATEFGAPTGSSDPKAVSEAQQAEYLTETYRYWSTLNSVGPLFTHSIRDWDPTGSVDWGAYLGVTHKDFSPKPSLNAIKTVING